MNSTPRTESFSPRKVILLGALVTGVVSAFPGLGIMCSCLFGMAGILGGWFALRTYYRSGGEMGAGQAAWLGLYGAALGTLAAMGLHLLMGDLSPTHENLQSFMDQFREYLVKNGASQAEANARVKEMWPYLVSSLRWSPLFLVLLNSAGGAGGGALASLFAAAREGREGKGPHSGSSSRMEQ